MKALGQMHVTSKLQWKLGILRGGKIVHETDYSPNMITDTGLNNYGAGTGSSNQLGFLANCILGTAVSPTPVRRDGGAITFTQTGTTLTASAPFFAAADVGRLFKYGTGTAGSEQYISAFTSTTVVTVSVSQTVGAATVGTIWYVNTAAITTPITGLTWTKQATGNSSSAVVVGSDVVVTHTCINISSALASNVTVTEIAINNNTTNSNVYDRDLINPTVALLTGDQALVTIQLINTYVGTTSYAVANVATGYNSAGDAQIESLGLTGSGTGIAYFTTAGVITAVTPLNLEPAQSNVYISALQAPVTLAAFNANTPATTGTATTVQAQTLATYGTGNRYRDLTVLFSISQANGLIYGVCIGGPAAGGRFFTIKFTSSFTKLSTQTLSFTFRKSWSRVLTN